MKKLKQKKYKNLRAKKGLLEKEGEKPFKNRKGFF